MEQEALKQPINDGHRVLGSCIPAKICINIIHSLCIAQLSMRGGLKCHVLPTKNGGSVVAAIQKVDLTPYVIQDPIHVTIYSCCCKVTYLVERFIGRQSHFVVQDLILRLHVSVCDGYPCWVGLHLFYSCELRRCMDDPSAANTHILLFYC